MVKRDWKKIFIFGILTGGLYNWYIIYSMYIDIKQMEEQTNNQKMSMITFFLLSICTGSLFAFFACYTYHKKALTLAETYNTKIKISSPFIFALIAMYVPVLSYMIPITNHNKLIDGYQSSYAFRINESL